MKKIMNRRILLISVISFAIALVAASPAVPEPPVPGWPRGSEGTTYQAWSFGDNDSTPAPDTAINEYGTPLLNVDTEHGWYDELDQKQGVWALSGEIDIVVPNAPQQNPYKNILLYLVWKPEENDPTGSPFNTNPFLPNSPLVAVTPFENMQMGVSGVLEDGWNYSTYDITIWPNPEMEWFTVKGNILVDYLAIDTICVPEPATMSLIIAGALVALRRKKK